MITNPIKKSTSGSSAFKLGLKMFAVSQALLVTVFAAVSRQSPDIVNPANGHKYHLTTQGSWQHAEAYALSIGGHLVAINSQAEEAWIKTNFGNYEGVQRAIWIGLSDQAQEGVFTWTNGEPVTYTNWGSGEPNDYAGNEDFAHIIGGPLGPWNDVGILPNTPDATLDGRPAHGVVELLPGPEIEVRQPATTNLVNGGSRNFGLVPVNGTGSMIFTIKNTGDGELNGLVITFEGQDEGMFSVTSAPTDPLPALNGSTNFTVQFSPTSSGSKTAILRLANNDMDENPFEVTLLGNVSSIEAWRQTHFGSIANSGEGADLNDSDKDGILNLTEYAFALNPKQNSAGLLPTGQQIGGNYVVFYAQPSTVNGISYGAEWSTTMLPDSWTAIPDTGSGAQRVFSVPIVGKPKLFFRHRVVNPQ